MTDPTPNRRWYHLTPDRFVIGLLAVECLLWLSERFQWFSFNSHKGRTVLIALATVGVAMLVMLLWFVASLVRGWRLQFSIRSLLLLVLAVVIPCWLVVQMKWAMQWEAAVAIEVLLFLMLPWFTACLLFRWQFQFSIRSLLVLVVVVAIPCSWLAVQLKKASQQREAVAVIEKSGGEVEWLGPIEPAWLRRLLGDDFCQTIGGVIWKDVHVTDALLENLKRLSHIRRVCLIHTQITNAGLKTLIETLSGLNQFQDLSIWEANITDAGLETLDRLRQLQRLELIRTGVTNLGLVRLKGMNQLNSLDLKNTQITDGAVETLAQLNQLGWLDLRGTKVTDAGLKKLQQALPNCTISR